MGEIQERQLYSYSVNDLWEDTSKHIGNVSVGDTREVRFKSLYELDVKDIKTSCGCTSAKYDKTNKELIVTYKAKPIPKHLVPKGFYNSSPRNF